MNIDNMDSFKQVNNSNRCKKGTLGMHVKLDMHVKFTLQDNLMS